MGLKLWVCRDPKGAPNEEYVFYRTKSQAWKVKGVGQSVWYWDESDCFWTLSVEDSSALKKAGLTLEPGEGPVRIELEFQRVK